MTLEADCQIYRDEIELLTIQSITADNEITKLKQENEMLIAINKQQANKLERNLTGE